jgi:hypothetical protein
MQIEQWPIERLIEYARNPRKNDHAVDRVAAAIKDFGFRVPIIAKSDGSIVDGHLRLKAAQKLSLTEVPVVLADDMTDVQIKAFRLSVNRMADLAEWDKELLALELEELKIADVDLSIVGWELNELIEEENQDNDEENQDNDVVPLKDPNILVRLSFHPGIWLGKRQEIMDVFARMEKTYACAVRVEE